MMGVHFAVDVVLDETNQIIKVFSGDPSEVQRAGSEFCRGVYETKVSGQYDVAIVSPGGYNGGQLRKPGLSQIVMLYYQRLMTKKLFLLLSLFT